VLREIQDKAFDLCLTDPPYGIQLKMQRFTKPGRPNSYSAPIKHKGFDDSVRPSRQVFIDLFRVSQNQIIWGATNFYDLLPLNDSWIFWNKMNGEGSHFADGEFAFTSFSCSSKMFSCSQHHGTNGGKNRVHPTQKPVALFVWCLINYSKPGDLIIDPFCGSGTTAIACHKTGRKFLCIDKDEEYIKIAQQRYADLIAQQDLFRENQDGAQNTSEGRGTASNS